MLWFCNKSFPSQLRFYRRGSGGNLTGLPTPICSWGNIFSWCLLMWGSAGERCMTRRLLSNLWWPVARRNSPSRRDSQGTIYSHNDWNDREVMFSLVPVQTSSIQILLLDQHDGSLKVETSREGRSIQFSTPHQIKHQFQLARPKGDVSQDFSQSSTSEEEEEEERWNALI